MTYLSVSFTSESGASETKRLEIQPENHLQSLGHAIQQMQAEMNTYLTKIMQLEAGGQTIGDQKRDPLGEDAS